MDLGVVESVRSDGLRVISRKLSGTDRVRITITTLAGSAYDGDKSGLFHFFEHMAFQGTKTRTAEEIATFLGRYFLYSNASTGKLETKYYGEGVSKNWEKICDILSDMYLNSIFPESELEREKQVIINEAKMYADNDDVMAYFALQNLLWKKPAGEIWSWDSRGSR